MPVTLRKTPISGGRLSLIADTYPAPEGKGRTEALRLYLIEKPVDKLERDANKQALSTARAICLRKANEQAKPEIYSQAELALLKQAEKGKYSFAEFCRQQIRKIDGGSRAYTTAVKYFFLSIGMEDIRCGDINHLMVDEFREYLPEAKMFRRRGTISQNSAATYMGVFKSLLKDAYKAGYLATDISELVPGISPAEPNGEDVPTWDDLEKLWNTPCSFPGLKNMAFCSALSGLRYSDLNKLERAEIKNNGAGTVLDFSQKKTSEEAVLPISDAAAALIPPTGEKPFADIDYDHMQRPLKKWVADAGLRKNITFHKFRHFFANMLLNNGIDLPTVSKMLGHKSIRSTQVYVTINEGKKLAAANSIKPAFEINAA